MAEARQRMDHILDEENDAESVLFELDVPDHLPGSPLCPLSPKHKSGGKAMCPLHGRSKTGMIAPPPSKSRGAIRMRTELEELGAADWKEFRRMLRKGS